MLKFGIDLGTTNSSVAVLSGANIRVFKDGGRQMEYTPSAVYINGRNELTVGVEAKQRVFVDPSNAVFEFKRNMGADSPFRFEESGRVMQPEELSAEVLKELNGHVTRSGVERISAAVVTVPADFDKEQNDATMRAASMAGIKHCVLLPEPIAAAQAYSFKSVPDKTFWLVYDFGGGTFDAALIQVRDGEIKVVGHKGDNRLGGSDIDVAIINELLIPALPEIFTDQERREIRARDPRWNALWSKFKGRAEEAKIALSNPDSNSAEIAFEYLCKHPSGEHVQDFAFTLRRTDLEKLATPTIKKTVNLTKELLTEARLRPENIGKMILVGGPTMTPLLRSMVAKVGIPLEFGVDPLTVVAQGAAIFAAGQFVGDEPEPEAAVGGYAVKLSYQPVSPDEDPEVAGTVIAYGGAPVNFAGFTVEFVNDSIQPSWRSGKKPLSPRGVFMTTLVARAGLANRFSIELSDPQGAIQMLEPSSLEIVVSAGGVIGDPVHNHNVGVELVNDEVMVFFKHGEPLVGAQTHNLKTTVTVTRGEVGRFLCVPIIEGDRSRASRNRRIGELIITGQDVGREVPAGSSIRVTLEVDRDWRIYATGYIPLLDATFKELVKTRSDKPDPGMLADMAAAARNRISKLRIQTEDSADPTASRILIRIDEELLIVEAEQLALAAVNDEGSGRQCINVLNRLNSALDDVETALEWPTLTADADEELARMRETLKSNEHVTKEDRTEFDSIESDIKNTIRQRSADRLRRCISQLALLRNDILSRDPAAWIITFGILKSNRASLTDQTQADRLFALGERAIQNKDVAGIKTAVQGLWKLEPKDSVSAQPETSRPETTVSR